MEAILKIAYLLEKEMVASWHQEQLELGFFCLALFFFEVWECWG